MIETASESPLGLVIVILVIGLICLIEHMIQSDSGKKRRLEELTDYLQYGIVHRKEKPVEDKQEIHSVFCEACGAELKKENIDSIGPYYFITCENCNNSFYIKKKTPKYKK